MNFSKFSRQDKSHTHDLNVHNMTTIVTHIKITLFKNQRTISTQEPTRPKFHTQLALLISNLIHTDGTAEIKFKLACYPKNDSVKMSCRILRKLGKWNRAAQSTWNMSILQHARGQSSVKMRFALHQKMTLICLRGAGDQYW